MITQQQLNDVVLRAVMELGGSSHVNPIIARAQTLFTNAGVSDTGRRFHTRVSRTVYGLVAAGQLERLSYPRGWYRIGTGTPVAAPVAPVVTRTDAPVLVELAPAGDALCAALATIAATDPAELLRAAKRLTREHLTRLQDAEDAIRTVTAIAQEEVGG